LPFSVESQSEKEEEEVVDRRRRWKNIVNGMGVGNNTIVMYKNLMDEKERRREIFTVNKSVQ
jgi:hypothetical protein